jgi:hypothetical protein
MSLSSKEPVAIEQRGQREAGEATAHLPDKLTSRVVAGEE